MSVSLLLRFLFWSVASSCDSWCEWLCLIAAAILFCFGLWHIGVKTSVSGGVCLIAAAMCFRFGLWHLGVKTSVSGGVCLIAAAIFFVLVCGI